MGVDKNGKEGVSGVGRVGVNERAPHQHHQNDAEESDEAETAAQTCEEGTRNDKRVSLEEKQRPEVTLLMGFQGS